MRLRLPTTRTFACLFGGSVAGVIFMLVAGNALEALGPEPFSSIRTAYLAIFFALLLLAAYTAFALMVRTIIGFQTAFWTQLARRMQSHRLAGIVARTVPIALTLGDGLILAGWAVFTVGLGIAVPAMLRDMPL